MVTPRRAHPPAVHQKMKAIPQIRLKWVVCARLSPPQPQPTSSSWHCQVQTTMFKRIAAIAFIFGCTAVAWAILGSTIFYRTYNGESGLSGRVASTWGAPQAQAPPAIAREWHEQKTVEEEEKGKKTTRT